MDSGVLATRDLGRAAEFGNRVVLLVSAPLLAPAAPDSPEAYVKVQPLGVWAEAEEIRRGIQDSRSGYPIDLEVRVATHDRILSVFAEPAAPLILHFSGHGEPLGIGTALIVENEHGIASDFSADQLSQHLRLRRGPPCGIAVLNACYSQRFAEVFKEAGVPHIIAISANQTVLDEASRRFSRVFYMTLLRSGDVRAAFATARLSVKTHFETRQYGPLDPTGALFESLKFVHEIGPSVSKALFFEDGVGQLTLSDRAPTNLMPISADPFIGRQRVLHEIAVALSNPLSARVVHLKAIGGMGKTATALATGRWHHERDKFPDGVWQVLLRSVTSVEQARSELAQLLNPSEPRFVACLEGSRDKRHLFILDDLDALLQRDREGVVIFFKALLGLPFCRIVATSREALPDEIDFRTIAIEQFERSEAIEVFRRYAGEENVSLRDEAERSAFASIITFLDGYAFPIRLAAAYLKRRQASFAELHERLLAAPQATLQMPFAPMNRETSLAATLEISYEVLSGAARDALAVLAHFPGGLTSRSATYVGIRHPSDVFAELDHFSMAEFTGIGLARRALLPEPARQFVLGKAGPDMQDVIAPQYLDYLTTLTEQRDFEPRLFMLDEKRNVYAMLDFGLKQTPKLDVRIIAGRIAVALAGYWRRYGVDEGRRGIEYLIAANVAALDAKNIALQGESSRELGASYASAGDDGAALSHFRAAVDAFTELEMFSESGTTREAISVTLLRLDRLPEGAISYAEAAADFATAEDPISQARVLMRQAAILQRDASTAPCAIEPLKLAAKLMQDLDASVSARALYDAAMIELAGHAAEMGARTLVRAAETCPLEEVTMLDAIVAAARKESLAGPQRARLFVLQARSMETRGAVERAALLYEEAGDELMATDRAAAVAQYRSAFDRIGEAESASRDRITTKLFDISDNI